MLAIQASFLVFLFFASTAFAGRVSFFARYLGGQMGPQHTSTATEYTDDKSASILTNMNTWSSGEYVANENRLGIVVVKAHDNRIYASKSEASDAIRGMQYVKPYILRPDHRHLSIVNANYQPPTDIEKAGLE
ncbi:hypothetical protein NPX13_g4601 [Xylaria arbuscula]|uniref:Uncharacterized protein n=1 Tax=Xylaria arbuscula TaxID=114810 RepID=A0A9W8NFR8_9PEZI|nr:hypothetical protein NPX13_g4601 [Xylaria arbuscula]